MASLYGSLYSRVIPRLRGNVALTTPHGTEWTYGELSANAQAAGAHLQHLGIKPGDRVAFLLPNSPHYAAALLGCFAVGAVAVPLDPRCTVRELWQQARLVGPSLLVAPPRLATVLGPIARIAGIPKTADVEWLAAETGGHKLHAPRVASDAPAGILFTSGTTGGLRGVTLSHKALLANARACAKALRAKPADRVMGVLPFFHSFGLTAGLLTTLYAGSSMEVHAAFTPSQVFDGLADKRITVMPAVPAILSMLTQHAREKGKRLNLPNLRVVSGGAQLHSRTARDFLRHYACRLTEGYGLTEAGPVVSVDDYLRPVLGSVGRPLDGVNVKIMGPKGALAHGQVGEVWVKSPAVMSGYHDDPTATKAALQGGWLRTKDYGFLDSKGRLYLKGRSHEFINVGGTKVWPGEVEDILKEHPAVLDAGVVGAPHELMGQVPQAFVTLQPGKRCDAAMLRAHCESLLSPYKVPHRYVFLSRLPRTRIGKADTRKLRTMV